MSRMYPVVLIELVDAAVTHPQTLPLPFLTRQSLSANEHFLFLLFVLWDLFYTSDFRYLCFG